MWGIFLYFYVVKKEVVILIGLIIFIISYISYNNYKKAEIYEDYGITGGKINSYGIAGEFDTHSIKYEYEVDDIKYYRGVTLNKGIDSCFSDVSKCQSYRLLVLYSNNNHSESIINVKQVFSSDIDNQDIVISEFE
jgi:hypothetical protein